MEILPLTYSSSFTDIHIIKRIFCFYLAFKNNSLYIKTVIISNLRKYYIILGRSSSIRAQFSLKILFLQFLNITFFECIIFLKWLRSLKNII